jgi:hypothetical protein
MPIEPRPRCGVTEQGGLVEGGAKAVSLFGK